MYKERTTTLTVVSILTILFSVLAVCGSAALIAGGVGFKTLSDPSMMATISANGGFSPTEQAQLSQVNSQIPPEQMVQYGNMFTVVGLIGMVLYFAMFIFGIGLWALKKWAYFGVIVTLALHAIFTGASGIVLQNFNILSVVEIVIPVVMIAVLLLDKSTSQQFIATPPPPDNFGMGSL